MQILVVVASTQVRTLRTEVEKGSMRTAIGHGLVGPKIEGNSVIQKKGEFIFFFFTFRKGM